MVLQQGASEAGQAHTLAEVGSTPIPATIPSKARASRRGRGMNPGLKALERRLVKSTLTEEDKEQLAFVRRLLGLKRSGATLLEMARETQHSEPQIRQFMKRGVYALYRDYILQAEVGDNDKQVATIVKDAKHRFAQFAPDAMDFYAYAFERNSDDEVAEKGPFKDKGLAQWATEKVSKGLGLDAPEHAIRPVVNIELKLIHAENALVAADDEEARLAIAKDVTPLPAVAASHTQ